MGADLLELSLLYMSGVLGGVLLSSNALLEESYPRLPPIYIYRDSPNSADPASYEASADY